MTEKKQSTNVYDDGNIPEIDLPHGTDELGSPKQAWATRPQKNDHKEQPASAGNPGGGYDQ